MVWLVASKSILSHVSAAIQLSNEDKHPFKGDAIKYKYTDSQHEKSTSELHQ
jgi:hypothetical protein